MAVRFTSTPDQVRPIAAREVAKQRASTGFKNHPSGVGANVIDDLWDEYEPHLPAAIREVEAGRATDPVWDVIKLHIIAQAVRHPDFDEAARTYLKDEGIEEPSRDQIQRERVRTLDRTPELLAECRIAFVKRPPDGPRFVVNDKGYATLEDPDNRKGVFLSLVRLGRCPCRHGGGTLRRQGRAVGVGRVDTHSRRCGATQRGKLASRWDPMRDRSPRRCRINPSPFHGSRAGCSTSRPVPRYWSG